jgi:hypothetical protein
MKINNTEAQNNAATANYLKTGNALFGIPILIAGLIVLIFGLNMDTKELSDITT